jgi:hypothetical protein
MIILLKDMLRYEVFELPTGLYAANPVVIDALDKLFILHADHEQNCSTSTVRMVGHLMRVYLHLFLRVSLRFGDHYMEELIKLY